MLGNYTKKWNWW